MNLFFCGVTLILNFFLRFVLYCILLSEFVGQYVEYVKKHDVSNIKTRRSSTRKSGFQLKKTQRQTGLILIMNYVYDVHCILSY